MENRDNLRNSFINKIVKNDGSTGNNNNNFNISESIDKITKTNTNTNNLKNELFILVEKNGYNLKNINVISAISLFLDNLGRI